MSAFPRPHLKAEGETHCLSCGTPVGRFEFEPCDKLHTEASAYANVRAEESVKYRTELRAVPFNKYSTGEIWLAHYEGFKAGFKSGVKCV